MPQREKGRRRGKPGRRPDPNKKRMVSVKLPPWLIEWLRRQDVSQAVLIERALMHTHNISEDDHGSDSGNDKKR